MSGRLITKSNVTIGDNSDGNLVVQDSNVENLILCSNNGDMFKILSRIGRYDEIQKQVSELVSVIKTSHPLYPNFGATYRYDLNKLVSTPETEDALKLYPKYAKSLIRINYRDYPYMDKSELPWEYAYRTQEPVTVDAKSYKEYLGDNEDPFPVIEYEDGMQIVINPPEFPLPFEGTIESGDVSIPILIRRKPCKQFGRITFGTVSEEQGFSFDVTTNDDFSSPTFNFKMETICGLKTQLIREKFFESVRLTKSFQIRVDNNLLMSGNFEDYNLSHPMFRYARHLIRYIECLLKIQDITGCCFDEEIGEISMDDLRTAEILAVSLQGNWLKSERSFDNEARCDYDKIDDSLLKEYDSNCVINGENEGNNISLQGCSFYADKYKTIYYDAQINNLSSVIKNYKKKKKNILLTFKPVEGKKTFIKLSKFEGIKLLEE